MHNKCMRMMTGRSRYSSTVDLLKKSNMLSVHQTVAQQSAVQVFNVLTNRAPAYHYQRLFPHLHHGTGQMENMEVRSVTNLNSRVNFSGALGRSSYFYQSSRIWCALPMSIKTAGNVQTFKTRCKNWVKMNIKIKP